MQLPGRITCCRDIQHKCCRLHLHRGKRGERYDCKKSGAARLSGHGVKERNAPDRGSDENGLLQLSGKEGYETMPWGPAGVREVYVPAEPDGIPLDTHVMAPLGDVLCRGIVVAPRGGLAPGAGTICAEFTPPVKAEKPFDSIDYVVCPASRVTLGWF